MVVHDIDKIIERWPAESREAARLVIEKYGRPDEATNSLLIWYDNGPWKMTVASRDFHRHAFPVPHIDAVETFIPYSVPPEKHSLLAAFDGSVVVYRTRGLLSARCHDEQANFLALNLAHDIITGQKTVEEAREYYGHEFLAYRRKEPTPYMDGLRFEPQDEAAYQDERILSHEELEEAKEQGQKKAA